MGVEAELEAPEHGLKRTLKDLFSGAVGGVAQVLLGMYLSSDNKSWARFLGGKLLEAVLCRRKSPKGPTYHNKAWCMTTAKRCKADAQQVNHLTLSRYDYKRHNNTPEL
jgi:hypothetical protein